MKGLLIKDFELGFLNGKMLAALCMVSIFLSFSSTGSVTFIISYVTIVFFMFVLSSISYDEIDHSMSFLFTLPISRKIYVLEKYVFSLACGLIGLVFSTVLCIVLSWFKNITLIGPDFFLSAVIIYCVQLFVVAFMLPIQLKFGADNGRIALFLIFGVIVAVLYIGSRLLERFHIHEDDIINFLDRLLTTKTAVVIPAFILSVLAALGISYGISLKIMERKAL